MLKIGSDRTPGFKLFLAIVVGFVLTIPLVSVYLLAYDRESQSREASRSITAGWGGPQTMTGPVLVIPYKATATETTVQNGQSVTRTNEVTRELTLAPEIVELSTDMKPEVRKRSISPKALAQPSAQAVSRKGTMPTTRSPARSVLVLRSYSQTSPSLAAKRLRWTSNQRPAIRIRADWLTTWSGRIRSG